MAVIYPLPHLLFLETCENFPSAGDLIGFHSTFMVSMGVPNI
jgi:hypothetical protein